MMDRMANRISLPTTSTHLCRRATLGAPTAADD
jgi:hypothetical protein